MRQFFFSTEQARYQYGIESGELDIPWMQSSRVSTEVMSHQCVMELIGAAISDNAVSTRQASQVINARSNRFYVKILTFTTQATTAYQEAYFI